MKTIGLARLGRDAEVRYLPDGTPVCNVSLATNYGKKGDDGNRKTQWIDAALFGQRAESLAQYLVKGSVHCFTLSEIHMETYQGSNGTGYKIVARCDDIELGPRIDGANGPAHTRQERTQQQRPASQPTQQQAAQPPSADDDIPF